jgi:hypothetical protein
LSLSFSLLVAPSRARVIHVLDALLGMVCANASQYVTMLVASSSHTARESCHASRLFVILNLPDDCASIKNKCYLFILEVLGVEFRASSLLSGCSTT